MNKDLARQFEADLSERILKDFIGNEEDFEIMPLMNEDKGRYLNFEGLKIFLNGNPRSEDILWLLKDLNLRKHFLPDFISKYKDGTIEFHEVKHREKIKLSQVEQKQALKELADEGFMCFVVNVKGHEHELAKRMNDDELKTVLKSFGQEKKNEGIIIKNSFPIQVRYKQRDTLYPLIKLVDLEWRFVKE